MKAGFLVAAVVVAAVVLPAVGLRVDVRADDSKACAWQKAAVGGCGGAPNSLTPAGTSTWSLRGPRTSRWQR